jgi:hypothetical protein
VIDEKTSADFCPGVNLNSGEEPAEVREQASEKAKPVSPEKMSQSMPPQGLQSWITEDNL